MTIAFYDASQVEERLDYPGCIDAVRRAMTALSSGERPQPLRQIFTVGKAEMFGIMPGELAALSIFGAKLVSVFGDPDRPGRSRHQGVVVVYDGTTGAVSSIADAEPVNQDSDGLRDRRSYRCACPQGRSGSRHLRDRAFRQNGTFARCRWCGHFDEIFVWGRTPEKTREFAEQMSEELDRTIVPMSDAQEAAARAGVICTVTSSDQPVILGEWVRAGTHINLVGSSYLGPVEVDTELVARARYVADYRPGILAQAAELAVARDAGVVDDRHVICEIGDVFAGRVRAREDDSQVTIYKSLGHVVQDLAATAYLHARGR